MLTVVCPGCQGQLQAPPTMAGKIAHCPRCKQQIRVPAAPPPTTAASKPTAAPSRKHEVAASASAAPPRKDFAVKAPAKATASSVAKPNVKASTPRQPADGKSSWFKIPQVSRGMRWFLIIVVVPIAVLNLPRLFTSSSFHFSGGNSSSGSKPEATPEEIEALAQKAADLERQAQAANRPQYPIIKKPPVGEPVLNGDNFGMTLEEFRAKYRDNYKEGIPYNMNYQGHDYGVELGLTIEPNQSTSAAPIRGPIRTKALHYTFLNGRFGRLTALIEPEQSAALIAELTKQLQAPPSEFDAQGTSENLYGTDGSYRPQLRWENDLIRVTLMPTRGNGYGLKILHKVHAKPVIDFYTVQGRGPK